MPKEVTVRKRLQDYNLVQIKSSRKLNRILQIRSRTQGDLCGHCIQNWKVQLFIHFFVAIFFQHVLKLTILNKSLFSYKRFSFFKKPLFFFPEVESNIHSRNLYDRTLLECFQHSNGRFALNYLCIR